MKPLFWVLITGIPMLLAFKIAEKNRDEAQDQNFKILSKNYAKARLILRPQGSNHYFVIDSTFKYQEVIVDNDGRITSTTKNLNQ